MQSYIYILSLFFTSRGVRRQSTRWEGKLTNYVIVSFIRIETKIDETASAITTISVMTAPNGSVVTFFKVKTPSELLPKRKNVSYTHLAPQTTLALKVQWRTCLTAKFIFLIQRQANSEIHDGPTMAMELVARTLKSRISGTGGLKNEIRAPIAP